MIPEGWEAPWHVQPPFEAPTNPAEAESCPDPSRELFPAAGTPWGGCSKAFPSLPPLSGVPVSQLRKGFWLLLELIFLAANGALNTLLGLQASPLTVVSDGIFLQ